MGRLVIAKSSHMWILLLFSLLLTYLFITVLEFEGQAQLMEAELGRRVEMIPPQDDPWLIQFVKEQYILSPNLSKEYNLTKRGRSNPDQSEGQVSIMKRFFQGQESGFFIECGASDGEFLSNTLWFEIVLGWNGLLIEADPDVF